MKSDDTATFHCPECGEALEAKGGAAGRPVSCPSCSQPMVLDVQPVSGRSVTRRCGPHDSGVPLKVGLGEAGGFETTVSRQDAGRMGHTFLGGLLVALGVFVCALFGIRWSKQS